MALAASQVSAEAVFPDMTRAAASLLPYMH